MRTRPTFRLGDQGFGSRDVCVCSSQHLSPAETTFLATDRDTAIDRVQPRRGTHADDFVLTEELAATTSTTPSHPRPTRAH